MFFSIIFCVLVFKKDKKRTEPGTEARNQVHLASNVNIHSVKHEGVNTDGNATIRQLQYFTVKDKGYHTSVWPKDGLKNYYEFSIAGITHGEHVDEHIGEFVAMLIPEPSNMYDENAIQIITREGHRIGYVPRDLTDDIRLYVKLPYACFCYIGTFMDGARKCYFSCCYLV